MSDPLNQCPECGTLETRKEYVDWVTDGVDIIFSCSTCELEFVASLRGAIKEVTVRYDDTTDTDG